MWWTCWMCLWPRDFHSRITIQAHFPLNSEKHDAIVLNRKFTASRQTFVCAKVSLACRMWRNFAPWVMCPSADGLRTYLTGGQVRGSVEMFGVGNSNRRSNSLTLWGTSMCHVDMILCRGTRKGYNARSVVKCILATSAVSMQNFLKCSILPHWGWSWAHTTS